MLRNEGGLPQRFRFRFFLNEVLSLNAQECAGLYGLVLRLALLNEVLSLNAQEFHHPAGKTRDAPSSMKS